VVSWLWLVSGWALQETEISAAPWALEAQDGLYYFPFLLLKVNTESLFTIATVSATESDTRR